MFYLLLQTITVLVNFDKGICEGGQDVPMMLLQLNAVDRFNQTENSGYIEQLIILVKEEIQVPGTK